MATMFKKYMLKLTNTVGTVQYLNKITKDNDRNNNSNSDSNASSRKSNKKYRNSMTAEMLLDIGPLLPSAVRPGHTGGRQTAQSTPGTPSPNNDLDAHHLFDDVYRRPPVRHRSLDDCDGSRPGYLTPPQSSENDTEEEEMAVHDDSSSSSNGNGDSDDDPMAVLSAAILELRNTLLYYSLVLPTASQRRAATMLMRSAPVWCVICLRMEYYKVIYFCG